MSRTTVSLVAATIISALTAIGAGNATRIRLAEKAQWVEHTAEVKLGIASAKLHLAELTAAPLATRAEGEAAEALNASVKSVCSLTADNPRQQARCKALEVGLGKLPNDPDAVPDLQNIFREMSVEEDALMAVRRASLVSARDLASVIALVAIGAALLFALLLLWRLRVQTLARLLAETAVRRESALSRAVVDGMGDAVLAVYPDRKFLLFNNAARRLLGPGFPDTALPEDWQFALEAIREDGTPMPPARAPLARALRGESCDNVVYRLKKASDPTDQGSWVSTTTRPVYDDRGTLVAAVAVIRDITDLKRGVDLLRSESISDEMTGLYNRRGFVRLAQQALQEAAKDALPLAVIFADMNSLKRINDELGHEYGDKALRALAGVLRATFPSAVTARLGGDEFALALAGVDEPCWVSERQRLLDALAVHNEGNSPFRLSLSIGAAFYDPHTNRSLEDLLDSADQDMYEHKRERRNLSLPVLRSTITSGRQ